MKKISLLAVSISLGLVGCDDSNGNLTTDNSNTGSPTQTVVAMDGYFKDALAFIDTNNDGAFSVGNDYVLGMTNAEGQVQFSQAPSGVIAIQTVKLNSPLLDAYSEYKGKYTIDMDRPFQSITNEIVLRAPENSPTISPITDLIVIEMTRNGKTQADAENTVITALGLPADADLYIDFVNGNDKNATLHKIAQILTESKANNPVTYATKATEFTNAIVNIVNNITQEQLNDANFIPIILDLDLEGDFNPLIIENSNVIVSNQSIETTRAELESLNLSAGDTLPETVIDLTGLFIDADTEASTMTLSSETQIALTNAGIAFSIEGDQMTLSSNQILPSTNINIVVSTRDITSIGIEGNTVSASFDLVISTSNTQPTIENQKLAEIESALLRWNLQQGVPFEQTLSVTGLYTDNENDTLTLAVHMSAVSGLTAFIDSATEIMTVSGTPTNVTTNGQLYISANDNQHGSADEAWVEQVFSLPDVKVGTTPPPAQLSELENVNWYQVGLEEYTGDSYDFIGGGCSTLRFSNGVIYRNNTTNENLTTCTETAGSQFGQSTYTVADDKIIASIVLTEDDGVEINQELIFEFHSPADNIAAGAKTVSVAIGSSESTIPNSHVTFFREEQDAERYINIQSDENVNSREFITLIANEEQPDSFNQLKINTSLSSNLPEQAEGKIYFQSEIHDLTCDDVAFYYDEFLFSGKSISGFIFRFYSSETIDCYTQEENGLIYSIVNFSLPALVESEIYSLLALNRNGLAENIAFNITWTGTGQSK